jgi:dephospho-CoA kinase
MITVALTGGIATGKSYVLTRLRERGIPTIDADEIVHKLLSSNNDTTKAITNVFGPAVIKPDGVVDRARLGEIVFADADARIRLERLIHPKVYEIIHGWFQSLQSSFGVASIPLLFETERQKDFEFVVVTACTLRQQLERITARGLSEEDAKRRVAAQMPTAQKVKQADFVISTSGTTDETDQQVEELVGVLKVKGGR